MSVSVDSLLVTHTTYRLPTMSHLGRTYTHLRLRPASVAVAPIVPPRFVSFARPNSSYAGLPFKPPPIRQRLRPLLPFFIYWCIITSLTVHSLRIRIKSREDLDKVNAKVTVLEGLIGRIKNGEKVGDDEVQRELEMVGLRERRLTMEEEGEVSEGGDVGWMEAIFGWKSGRRVSRHVTSDVSALAARTDESAGCTR
jgi:hypothetical protein